MFLYKSHQNSSGPLFAMKVEKLWGSMVLEFINFHVIILCGNCEENELHPWIRQHFDFLRHIIVHSFIKNLQRKIDNLRTSNVVLYRVEDFREDSIEELTIVVAFFLDDTKLKVCANGKNTMEHCRNVLIAFQMLNDFFDWDPSLVLEANHITEDFSIKFDQHVLLGASDDSHDQ